MTKRYYVVFFIISMVIAIATSSIKVSRNKMYASAGKSYSAESVQQLVHDAPLIIIAEVSGKRENKKDNHIDYTITEVKINEILKGNMLLDSDIIKVAQMNITQDPVVKEGEKVLLFLQSQKSSVIEDGYVCVGLSQGYYRIKDDKIVPSAPISYSLKKSIEKEKDIIEYVRLQAAVALQ